MEQQTENMQKLSIEEPMKKTKKVVKKPKNSVLPNELDVPKEELVVESTNTKEEDSEKSSETLNKEIPEKKVSIKLTAEQVTEIVDKMLAKMKSDKSKKLKDTK